MQSLVVGQLVQVRDYSPAHTHRLGTITQVLPEHLYVCVYGRDHLYKREDVWALQEEGNDTEHS